MFLGLFLIVSSITFAQESPIGPVGPDTTTPTRQTNGDAPKPAVDLPYKPSVDAPKSSIESAGSFEPIPEPLPEIPYIPSKSPEPLGAPDPEIN